MPRPLITLLKRPSFAVSLFPGESTKGWFQEKNTITFGWIIQEMKVKKTGTRKLIWYFLVQSKRSRRLMSVQDYLAPIPVPRIECLLNTIFRTVVSSRIGIIMLRLVGLRKRWLVKGRSRVWLFVVVRSLLRRALKYFVCVYFTLFIFSVVLVLFG